ncbi:WSC domain-containing protein [Dactylonectria macrodidyma]|uniref:WSC domain-containing protein n=1 Tax=Dactylonectria macrodidyma TaxID=307937 RepID=A0A9P9ENC5_9HYPO|nr:WSC domain-containing protein [Dactylonectria macrodidyma]
MKPISFLFLALGISLRFCAGSVVPELQWDPTTIDSCVEWFNNAEDDTCEEIRDYFTITPEQFSEWNPSVGLDYKPWNYQSYCIVTKERMASLTTTVTYISASTSTISTSSTSSLEPSPTAWSTLGCYADNGTLPALETCVSKDGGDTALTVAKCQNACYLTQYDFAGVEGGDECWCSNSVRGELLNNQTECNMPCSGNETDSCGGKSRISVFLASSVEQDEGDEDDNGEVVNGGTVIEAKPSDSGATRYRALF